MKIKVKSYFRRGRVVHAHERESAGMSQKPLALVQVFNDVQGVIVTAYRAEALDLQCEETQLVDDPFEFMILEEQGGSDEPISDSDYNAPVESLRLNAYKRLRAGGYRIKRLVDI
jgi:hypothetical protein